MGSKGTNNEAKNGKKASKIMEEEAWWPKESY